MFASFNARAVGLPSLSASETIDVAAEAGFAGVDVMVLDLVRSGVDPREVRSRMEDRGLVAGAFPCPIDWRGDEAKFRSDLRTLPPILGAAATLGLTRTGTWALPETRTRGEDPSTVVEFHRERLGALANLLEDFGIRLGLEAIGVESFRSGRGDRFVASLADLDRELGPVDCWATNLGLLVDSFHLHAADEPADAALSWGADRVVWVHVADLPPGAFVDRRRIVDAERGLPGENGAVDNRGLLAQLAEGGYDGPVTAEPLARCRSLAGHSPAEVASRVKAALDSVWPRG